MNRPASEETHGVRVSVTAKFLPDHSEPGENKFLFAYEVTIANVGRETVQLLRRHWLIRDADGHVEEVRGEGVVGETPILAPGQSFTYQSYCPLKTIYGTMRGEYEMMRPDGSNFDAQIPAFALMPQSLLN